MDIFDVHNVTMEKKNAMLQYRRFSNIAKLFRLVELFLAVVLLSWISTRLPFVFRIFSDYFRLLLSVIVSPLFIFLIGNVIVLTLVLKSGQFSGNFSIVDIAGADLFEEIVNNVTEDVPPVFEPEEIVYQDKRIISEVNSNTYKPITGYCEEDEMKVTQSTKQSSDHPVPDLDLKTYRRSQSENLMKRECAVEMDKLQSKLKRSETEIGRRIDDALAENVVDELSNEEFQRKIEGFIARQVRFHQEEKLSIVPHNLM